MQINRDFTYTDPELISLIKKIQKEIIDKHNFPMRIFETSRSSERHLLLLEKGKTKDSNSSHLYDFSMNPPLYSTAVDYVFYKNHWSWNLRDASVVSWYLLFGNLVLDLCPKLTWEGTNRKSVNYCHFQLLK
jgi:hypothetical protein